MIVLVHGYDGSGPGHWQRWLEDELRQRGLPVTFPDLPEPTAPDRDRWVAALAEVVSGAPTPVVLVCHSLGCWAVDHFLTEHGTAKVRAVLLVAPPSPYLLFEPVETFLPPPCRREVWAPLAERTLLVGSDNDDFTSPEELEDIAGKLRIRLQVIVGARHINVESGYGPWPLALEWLTHEASMETRPAGA